MLYQKLIHPVRMHHGLSLLIVQCPHFGPFNQLKALPVPMGFAFFFCSPCPSPSFFSPTGPGVFGSASLLRLPSSKKRLLFALLEPTAPLSGAVGAAVDENVRLAAFGFSTLIPVSLRW